MGARDLAGVSGRIPVYPRHLPDDVSRQTVDHAPVRWIRHRGAIERAFPLLAGAGADGSLGGLRSSHTDGIRLGSPASARRGGQGRGGNLLARRHGEIVRRHSHAKGLDVDDHQRHGGHPPGALRNGGQAPRRRSARAFRNGAKRHPEGVHRAGNVYLSAAAGDAHGYGPVCVVPVGTAGLDHDLHFRLSHTRGRFHRRARSGVHAGRRHCLRRGGDGGRTGGGRVRAAAVVFLQRP